MRLWDLTEGRDAPLYHGTPVDLFMSIMNEDTLEGGEPDDEIGYERPSVRLSRSYRTALGFSSMGAGQPGVVMEIDQATLVQNYKVVPFHDENYAGERMANKSEAEEVVLHNRIRPLSRVLTRFYVDPKRIQWVLQPENLETYLDSTFFSMKAEEVHALADFIMKHPKRADLK